MQEIFDSDKHITHGWILACSHATDLYLLLKNIKKNFNYN